MQRCVNSKIQPSRGSGMIVAIIIIAVIGFTAVGLYQFAQQRKSQVEMQLTEAQLQNFEPTLRAFFMRWITQALQTPMTDATFGGYSVSLATGLAGVTRNDFELSTQLTLPPHLQKMYDRIQLFLKCTGYCGRRIDASTPTGTSLASRLDFKMVAIAKSGSSETYKGTFLSAPGELGGEGGFSLFHAGLGGPGTDGSSFGVANGDGLANVFIGNLKPYCAEGEVNFNAKVKDMVSAKYCASGDLDILSLVPAVNEIHSGSVKPLHQTFWSNSQTGIVFDILTFLPMSDGGSVSVGKFNSDSRPDVVVSYPKESYVYVYEKGEAKTEFLENKFSTVLGGTNFPVAQMSGLYDFFGNDGYADIVSMMNDSEFVGLVQTNSAGNISLDKFISDGGLWSPQRVVGGVPDVNGDGLAEFYIGTAVSEQDQSQKIRFYISQGPGNPPLGIDTALESDIGLESCAPQAVDMNKDIVLDLVCNTSNKIYLLSQAPGPEVDGKPTGSGAFSLSWSMEVPPGVRLSVADLDGDSLGDIAYVDPTNYSLNILWNTGGGEFSSSQICSDCAQANSAPVVGDYNADGKIDLVTVGAKGGDISVRFNQGSQSFSKTMLLSLVDYLGADWVVTKLHGGNVGDFNIDFDSNTYPDLAAVASNNSGKRGILILKTTPQYSADPNAIAQAVLPKAQIFSTPKLSSKSVVAIKNIHKPKLLDFSSVCSSSPAYSDQTLSMAESMAKFEANLSSLKENAVELCSGAASCRVSFGPNNTMTAVNHKGGFQSISLVQNRVYYFLGELLTVEGGIVPKPITLYTSGAMFFNGWIEVPAFAGKVFASGADLKAAWNNFNKSCGSAMLPAFVAKSITFNTMADAMCSIPAAEESETPETAESPEPEVPVGFESETFLDLNFQDFFSAYAATNLNEPAEEFLPGLEPIAEAEDVNYVADAEYDTYTLPLAKFAYSSFKTQCSPAFYGGTMQGTFISASKIVASHLATTKTPPISILGRVLVGDKVEGFSALTNTNSGGCQMMGSDLLYYLAEPPKKCWEKVAASPTPPSTSMIVRLVSFNTGE